MRPIELLEEWHRALEIQQVLSLVLEDPQMTKRVIDQLVFGPKPPLTTLLQARTFVQHSLEGVCFRFVNRKYSTMLKSRDWESPKHCELQQS